MEKFLKSLDYCNPNYLPIPIARSSRKSNSDWSFGPRWPSLSNISDRCSANSLPALKTEERLRPVVVNSMCVSCTDNSVRWMRSGIAEEIKSTRMSWPWGSGETMTAGRTLRPTRIVRPTFLCIWQSWPISDPQEHSI